MSTTTIWHVFISFDLRGQFGLHSKATKVATSSWITSRLLDGKFCNRLHQHQPVLGGKAVTEPAGHYPHRLAKLLVDGIEKQFKHEYDKEAMAVEEYQIDSEEEDSPNLGRPAGEDESANTNLQESV
jgi:hypothetical protein